MARSGNRHTTAEFARALGMAYVFGVEFVELGLGDARERRWHAGQSNQAGLHGGALLSRVPLVDPSLIRLERDGTWFGGENNGERRVGGRIAMAAGLSWQGSALTVVAPHYESHSDPGHRDQQTRILMEAVERMAPGGRVVIGGDLNTKSMSRDDWIMPARRARRMAEDPARLMWPVPHEPMFARAAAAGYDWRAANPEVPTQRLRPGDVEEPLGRIDWFLTRGVDIRAASVVAAVDGNGTAISDHEILVIDVG